MQVPHNSDQSDADSSKPGNHLTAVSFSSLPLHPDLQKGLQSLGFCYCTPIQEKALPLALDSQDLAGQAQTGTGKTAAFLLATMHHLLTTSATGPAGQPRALIVAPTRELALQIHADAKDLAEYTGLRATVVYGGTGYESQRQTLFSGTEILIGTPGRLIDYYKQQIYSLRHIEIVVLDEADYLYARDFMTMHHLAERVEEIIFSPVFGQLPPRQLAEWILRDNLDVRVGLQIHKFIWDPETRGV